MTDRRACDRAAEGRAAWLPDAAEIRSRQTFRLWAWGIATCVALILMVVANPGYEPAASLFIFSGIALDAWRNRRVVDRLPDGLSGSDVTAAIDRSGWPRWSWATWLVILAMIALSLWPIADPVTNKMCWVLACLGLVGWQIRETLRWERRRSG